MPQLVSGVIVRSKDAPTERVAVTVRTNTFYTRTKIRKLAAPSTDADIITETALAVLDQIEGKNLPDTRAIKAAVPVPPRSTPASA